MSVQRKISQDDRLATIRRALEAASETWGEGGEAVLDSGLSYRHSELVRISVRKRGHRYDLSDEGAATRNAGKPPDWFEIVDRLVAEEGFNVNRRGVVFVPAVEGSDLASLALRLADCSYAAYIALLELDS